MNSAIPIPRFLRNGLLDIKLGFALMRDRRVPLRSKMLAVWLGLLVTALLEFFELPIETVVAALVPIVGAAGDILVDGLEVVAGPIILANVILPFVAPRKVVEQVRFERATPAAAKSGKAEGPIIDV